MNLLRRLSVGGKLAIGFTAALVLMIVCSLLSVSDLARMNHALHSITDDSLPSIENAAALALSIADYRRTEYRLVVEPSWPRDDAARDLEALRHTLAGCLARARSLVSSDAERQLVDTATAQWTHYAELSRQLELAARADSRAAAALFNGPGRQRLDTLLAVAEELVALNVQDAVAAAARADAIYGRTLRQLGSVVVTAVLSVGVLGYLITRSITRPLKAAVDAAQALSDDALTRPMPGGDGDEIAQLALALDHVSVHRSKSVSISKMSHELRTPLHAILGFAEVALTDRVQPLASVHRRHIERILRSGTHLVRLVDDLLDLSRIAAGFMVLRLEAVDALDIAHATVHELAPLAAPQRIEVSVTAGEGPIGCVRADRTRLAQVLANLVSNAIKYNRPGGRVRVELRAVGDRVQLAVRDTGIGLSRDQREGLFRPFDRLGRETTGIQGTGLGLVITHKLVQLMGGTLEVQSTPGVGSLFVVSLALAPVADPIEGRPLDDRRGDPEPADEPHRPAGSIVCVDDDETNRALVEAYLSRCPRVRLALASDGASAIATAARERADLMLIDIMMPGMDGFATLRAVRQHPQLRATRCVALSANAMTADVERALAAGFDGYLTKPLSIAQLLAEVNKWLPSTVRADSVNG